MDEKEQLLPNPGPSTVARQERRRAALRVLIAVFFVLVIASQWHGHLPRPYGCGREHLGRWSYVGESIEWEGCGELEGRPLECSNISVPMDQFDAKNSGTKTFSIPLIRLRGKNATQNLLLNPGGPGGSGLNFMHRKGKQLSTIVGEGFHLLSFDPRGVNKSRPLASCYPDKESRRELSGYRFSELIHDSAEAYGWSENFVRACSDTLGEHGKYVNTPQTAADMNSILDAVGQEDMVYWGFSYGTLLGQTYATLFPERSKRVIIDGVVNQFDWYQSLLDNESLVDTDTVFSGFFDECIKAGKNCTLSSLGDSPEKLRDLVTSFAERLKEQPLSVYVNNTVYGLLDFEKLYLNGIFPILYKPERWYSLSENLAKLLNGNATDAFVEYGRSPPWEMEGEANQVVHFGDGLTGLEHWPHDRESVLKMVLEFANRSSFGVTEGGMVYAQQQWAIPKTHTYVPKKGVKTAHPLLILSTTYDPVCPLVSARSALEAFEGSQIVEVKGYGHCSVAVASMCLAKNVRNYLYDGIVPSNYTQCDVDSPYFIVPEEDGKVVAHKHFDDLEEQKIHLAQMELARDWDVRRGRA